MEREEWREGREGSCVGNVGSWGRVRVRERGRGGGISGTVVMPFVSHTLLNFDVILFCFFFYVYF